MTATGTKKIRILVADDDPIMLQLTTTMLTHVGYEVFTARDGETALKAFAEVPHLIHLVIADAVMPGIGGLELLRAITDLSPSTARLLISGSPTIVSQAADTAFLAKPFRMDALASRVQALVAAWA
jgi:hypothetical protein